ncbi:alpha/beta fold hydrolase [Bradyrhizobium vignae]|uniref:Alpha/beta hydrolase n=1 Tax=Bradyrhizobium vignae TaxID=1549949 RepID=A0A2U3Q9R8_9BRAD|nr:alpha/beta hydrolase [Bradyrhizobium vignae]SPP98100.1 Alpha/beta hydrolase [Bradyrhizobium vignae]
MYQEKRAARATFVRIRTLDYHVLEWGRPAPGEVPIVMLHGWMDVAASWQFVVDAFEGEHWVIAPDLRGFGLTRSPGADFHWFGDLVADLDFLLDRYSPQTAVNLVGHSLGGNVTTMYAGFRPQRVRRLVNLEGYGLECDSPANVPTRFANWMDQLKAHHRHELELKSYDSAEAFAQRLMKSNPRLARDKADWLARHWARQDEQGAWRVLADPSHKIARPHLFRPEEMQETWRRIVAATLMVEASDPMPQAWQEQFAIREARERLAWIRDCRLSRIEDAGHMMHHDQPQQLAQLIESFVAT